MENSGRHFAQVWNDLSLAWARLHLSPVEASIVWVLQAMTLGAFDPVRKRVGRPHAVVSLRQLAKLTGYTRTAVHGAMRRLERRGVVRVLDAGAGRRGMRLSLCDDPRLFTEPTCDEPAETADVPSVREAAERITDPRLRALAVGFMSNARWTQEAGNGSCPRPLDTSDCSVQRTLDTGVQGPLDTTRLPETSLEKETARATASEEAVRARSGAA